MKLKDKIRMFYLKHLNYKVKFNIEKQKFDYHSFIGSISKDLFSAIKNTNEKVVKKDIFDDMIMDTSIQLTEQKFNDFYKNTEKYKKAINETMVCLDTKGLKEVLEGETIDKSLLVDRSYSNNKGFASGNFIRNC